MAYRAPELFDVKTGQTLDEKVDIWVRHKLTCWMFLTSFNLVIRMHTIRSCLLPFTL